MRDRVISTQGEIDRKRLEILLCYDWKLYSKGL